MPDPEDITLPATIGSGFSADDPATVADPVLLAAVDLARAAIEEITAPDSIGGLVGHVVEGEHVLSLLFDCTLPGYPGWHWTVSLARTDDDAPTVLETELMPGEYALTAPDWVPWSDRLMDGEGDDNAEDEADDADDETDDDESDEDEHDDERDDDEPDDDEDDEPDDGFDADRADDHLDGIDFDEALAAPHLHPEQSD